MYLSHVSIQFLDRRFLLPDDLGNPLVLLPLTLLFLDVLILLHIDDSFVELSLGLPLLLSLDILLENLDLHPEIMEFAGCFLDLLLLLTKLSDVFQDHGVEFGTLLLLEVEEDLRRI